MKFSHLYSLSQCNLVENNIVQSGTSLPSLYVGVLPTASTSPETATVNYFVILPVYSLCLITIPFFRDGDFFFFLLMGTVIRH